MSDYETSYTTNVPPALQKHVDEMVERFMEELTIATAAEQVLGFTKGMVLAAYCWQYPPHGIEAMQPGAVQRPGETLLDAAKRSNIIEMRAPLAADQEDTDTHVCPTCGLDQGSPAPSDPAPVDTQWLCRCGPADQEDTMSDDQLRERIEALRSCGPIGQTEAVGGWHAALDAVLAALAADQEDTDG